MTEDKIASALGELKGTLAAMNSQMVRNEAETRAHRDVVSAEIRAVRETQIRLVEADRARDTRIDGIDKRVSATEEITAAVKGWKAQATGILMVLGLIGTILSLFWKKILEVFGW